MNFIQLVNINVAHLVYIYFNKEEKKYTLILSNGSSFSTKEKPVQLDDDFLYNLE